MSDIKSQNSIMTYAMMALVVVGAYFLGVYKTRSDILGDPTQLRDSVQDSAEQVEMLTNLDETTWKLIQENPAYVLGDESAPVTMVEYTDYKCPYCAEYAGYDAIPSFPTNSEQVFKTIKEKYIDTGKVRYIFHDQPSIHGVDAYELAEVARCAGDQGKYVEMHDLLFENQAEITGGKDNPLINTLASQLSLNMSEFSTCLDGGKYEDATKTDSQVGTQAGATGTPTFYINGEVLIGAQPYSSFEELIEAKLGN